MNKRVVWVWFIMMVVLTLVFILASCAAPALPTATSNYQSSKVESYFDSNRDVVCYWLSGWPGDSFQCLYIGK